jgi:hypothetical protein
MKFQSALMILLILISPVLVFGWTASKSVDKMSDEVYFEVGKKSKGKVWSTRHAFLSIGGKCGEDKLIIMLTHPWLTDGGPVEMRFDKESSEAVYASRSSDSKSLFIGDHSAEAEGAKHPNAIVSRMGKHKKLLIQYRETGGSTVIAEFSLSGFEAAMSKKEKMCPKPKET